MLYRVYLHMLNQTNYNRLNLDQFVVGDPVIIKLKRFPTGNEYYGILYQINNWQSKKSFFLSNPVEMI